MIELFHEERGRAAADGGREGRRMPSWVGPSQTSESAAAILRVGDVEGGWQRPPAGRTLGHAECPSLFASGDQRHKWAKVIVQLP